MPLHGQFSALGDAGPNFGQDFLNVVGQKASLNVWDHRVKGLKGFGIVTFQVIVWGCDW